MQHRMAVHVLRGVHYTGPGFLDYHLDLFFSAEANAVPIDDLISFERATWMFLHSSLITTKLVRVEYEV